MPQENNMHFQNAQWIFVKDIPADVCNGYFDYQAELSIEENENVNLYISASTLYAVYINGTFVDCGQYAAYEDYQVYDTLDILPTGFKSRVLSLLYGKRDSAC